MKDKKLTQHFAEQRFKPEEQWMVDNLLMECIMGSHAYECNNPDSDYDIVGVVMDPHKCLYPQAYGFILGYDNNVPKFKNKECKGEGQKLVITKGKHDKVYEAAWHSLTNFFDLVSNGSPNLTEVLFVKRNLVTYAHDIGWMIRDQRKLFLSKKMYQSFKGYAYSQFARIRREAVRWETEHKNDNSNRLPLYEKHGYDVKMSYHSLRLLDLIHQLLTEGDLDLTRNKEECKAMRAGEWGSYTKFEEFFERRLKELDSVFVNSKAVPERPQRELVQKLLANCIEQWYGSESNMQKQDTEYVSVKMLMERLDRMESNIKRKITYWSCT